MSASTTARAAASSTTNLVVRPGEKIGLVGPSGAGKSTLVNLLLRLYDVETGQILIDGQDIAGVTQESLRAQIGMVTQDITATPLDSRQPALRQARQHRGRVARGLRQARADDFMDLLVDSHGNHGLDALVGERGVKLGRQRQRIAIARVLLKTHRS
jgi:ATP-binding cassette subfamily B multidrug efflux pump